jgi:hypothetical protein
MLHTATTPGRRVRKRVRAAQGVHREETRAARGVAHALGLADLRGCLQTLLDDGWSIPQLTTHLGTTKAAIRRAIEDHHVRQPSHRQQLARQRQHAGADGPAALPDTPDRTRVRRAGGLPAGPVCQQGPVGAAAVRRTGCQSWLAGPAAEPARPARLTTSIGWRRALANVEAK